MSSYSSSGQTNDSLVVVSHSSIVTANNIYFFHTQKIGLLERIVVTKDAEITELTLAYDHKIREVNAYMASNVALAMQNVEFRNIIKEKDKVIKIVAGVAVIAVGYGVYKTFGKGSSDSVFKNPLVISL